MFTIRNWLTRIGILTLLILPLGDAIGGTPMPHISAGKGEQCVEPTDVMRRDHMEFILHQRDETVHNGIRTKKHSFKECINCHVTTGADNKPVSFKDPDHFCSSCHRYAAVSIDCFQCHTSLPSND